MMYYFVQVNLLLIGFYLMYRIFMRQLTFYSFNRYLLLSIPVLSFILALVRSTGINEVTATYVLPVFSVISGDISISEQWSTSDWPLILSWIYKIGLSMFLARFIAILIKLYIHLRNLTFVREGNLKIAMVSNQEQSFSFFNHVVINEKDAANYDMIMTHEKEHVRLKHSLDKLYIELISCLFWFNPFIYLLKKDISSNHEFEVDDLLGTSEEEGRYILGISEAIPLLNDREFTNSFSAKSNLLKRITMMTKKPSRQSYKLNYLLIIPVAALGLVLFSCAEQLENQTSTENEVYDGDRLKEVTEMPQYPGGTQALYAFMNETIVYPPEAKEKGISGKVYVSFEVSSKGKVQNVKVIEGVHPLLDQTAVDVVKQMPDWSPGKVGEQAVAVQYMLPISFQLDEDKTSTETKAN